MEWEEISRRLRNGTSVSVLAELAGTTYKNMYNRIRRREQLDGKQYLKADQLKRPYKAQGGRKKAASVPEVKKKVPDPGPAASHSSNVILCEGCRHFRPETAKSRPYCKKYEHLCGLVYVCEGYAAGGPEVEPIGEEKAASVPEVVEKVAGVPEVVPNIPEALLPETVKEIAFQITYYEKLAERYRKQAEDYKRILQAFM